MEDEAALMKTLREFPRNSRPRLQGGQIYQAFAGASVFFVANSPMQRRKHIRFQNQLKIRSTVRSAAFLSSVRQFGPEKLRTGPNNSVFLACEAQITRFVSFTY